MNFPQSDKYEALRSENANLSNDEINTAFGLHNDPFTALLDSTKEDPTFEEFKANWMKDAEKAKKTEVLYFNQVLGLFDNYVRFEAGNDNNEDFTIEIALEEFELHLDCDTSKMYLLSEEDFLEAFDWCDSAKAIYDTWIKYGREGFDVTITK